MTPEQFKALGSYLVELFNEDFAEDCDATLKHTRAWLAANSDSPEEDLNYIRSLGGCCDCEVVLITPDPGDEEPGMSEFLHNREHGEQHLGQ